MDPDIRNWAREEDYITFLATRQKGDPLPLGVVAKNPFRSCPSVFGGDRWFFFVERLAESTSEGIVRKTENGFWKLSQTVTIPTESFFGVRNVFDFYQGNPPIGTRTCWVMHQYHARPSLEGACHVQDDSLLCRLFSNSDEKVHSLELNNSPAAFADFRTLGSDLCVREKDREDLSRGEADENAFVSDCRGDFIELNDLVFGDIRQLHNGFSDESYFKSDDLLSSETASTSSGDSSNMSTNFDEYFNIDELLAEIGRDGPVSLEDKENADCSSSFTGPDQLVQADRDKRLTEINSKGCLHLSHGAYLEPRDLLSTNVHGTGSCSSGDYDINLDELLRNIARDCSTSVNDTHSSPVSHPGQESVASCIGNIEVAEENEVPNSQPVHAEIVSEDPSTSCYRTVKRNLSRRSERYSYSSGSDSSSGSSSSSNRDSANSSKTPQSKRRKLKKKLAKIGKFFCLP